MRKARKNSLRQQWVNLCPDGVSLSRMLQAFDRIDHAYSDPQRRFHTLLTHIRILLDLQQQYFPNAPLDVILAIWFHDIFYLPGSKMSEEVSVEMMRFILYGIFPVEVIEAAADHILATITHEASENLGTQIMCDLDLLGLASDPEEYDSGVRRIRFEYGQFNETDWANGRKSFLLNLLSRASIFQTEEIHTWFESAAQSNVRRDYESLA